MYLNINKMQPIDDFLSKFIKTNKIIIKDNKLLSIGEKTLNKDILKLYKNWLNENNYEFNKNMENELFKELNKRFTKYNNGIKGYYCKLK